MIKTAKQTLPQSLQHEGYARYLHDRQLGVVLLVSPLTVHSGKLIDIDKLSADAVAHATALAHAQLPPSASDFAVMAQLERARLMRIEQERLLLQHRMESDLRANHAQFEQYARRAALVGGDAPTDVAAPADPRHGTDPQWSECAGQHEANTRPILTARHSEIRSALWGRAAFWVAVVFFVGMEVALVSQLNPMLVPMADPTAELTWIERVMQALAALMLVTCYGAASLLFTRATTHDGSLAERAANALVGAVLFTGGALLTATITWPAFGPMVEGLLTGHASASGMAVQGVDPTVPMALRLLTAAPLMGIGLMTGLMVRFAVRESRMLRSLRPLLRESEDELSPFYKAQVLRDALVACRGKQPLPGQDCEHIQACCACGLRVYLEITGRQEAGETPAHRVGIEERLRGKTRRDQLRARMQAAVQAHAAWLVAFNAHAVLAAAGGDAVDRDHADAARTGETANEKSQQLQARVDRVLPPRPTRLRAGGPTGGLNGSGGSHITPPQPI